MSNLPQCDVCEQSLWRLCSRQLMRCCVCGLVRAQMNPTKDELQKAYEHDYFFGGEYIDYIRDRQALEKNFRLRLTDLQQYLTTTSALIEIGCSYGFFLNICKDIVGKCIGYDITKEGIEYATRELGVTAYCDSFLNYTGPTVDMVCLWDVMEHLPNPGAVIAKIAAVVKPGGYIALSTGDIGSLVARIRGDKWRLVHPPTHLFYFDKHSITKLLSKNGFQIITFSHRPVFRNVDSIFQQLLARGRINNKKLLFVSTLYSLAKKLRLTQLNIGLNLFDIMDVVAIKKVTS